MAVRKVAPENLEEARDAVGKYILHYNNERLHSAINYITPIDKLEGRAKRKEANAYKIAA